MQNYDGTLHMLIEQPRPVNMERLAFLRWLIETRPGSVLDGHVLGPPSGALVQQPSQPAPSYSGRAA